MRVGVGWRIILWARTVERGAVVLISVWIIPAAEIDPHSSASDADAETGADSAEVSPTKAVEVELSSASERLLCLCGFGDKEESCDYRRGEEGGADAFSQIHKVSLFFLFLGPGK